jgi:mannonate dehydratase
MYVGTQLQARSDDDYRVFAQLGLEHICGYPPGPAKDWTPQLLREYREHVESFGLTLDFIPLPLGSDEISKAINPNIMLGKSPERDREIEGICNIMWGCAEAGIPAVKYNMTLLGVVTTDHVDWRGGSKTRYFNFDETPQEPAQTIAGPTDADAMWERLDYFLERVVPVAEENSIRMALHPHDPGMPRPGGFRGVDRVLGSVDGIKKYVSMHESPYHGLNFCQGTVSEMLERPGEEIYDVIRYFGERKKIFNVHFRNIIGGFLNFTETYIDDGDVDMHKAVQVYKEVDYPYMLMPDHVPTMAGENSKLVGFAYTYGYIRALIDSVSR